MSLWSFFETGVVEIFARDTRALQNIKIYILALVPVPILYYIKHYFGMKDLKLLNLIRDFTFVVFAACTILKITGIADFLESIFLVHINLGITALFIVYQAIRRWVKNIKNHRHDSVLFYLGFITICVSCAIDLVRFYIGSGETDAALFIRLGLFVAILCYGVLGLGSVVEKVKSGLEAEVISKLAYHDGLTGVANRTAYQEKVDEYEKSSGVSHIEIESEFEKMLLRRNGQDPFTYRMDLLIPTDKSTAESIYAFYRAFDSEKIAFALRNKIAVWDVLAGCEIKGAEALYLLNAAYTGQICAAVCGGSAGDGTAPVADGRHSHPFQRHLLSGAAQG